MSIDALKGKLPDYAKDLKLNLSGVFNTPNLTPQQAWGTAVASALASRQPEVIRAIVADAGQHLEPAALNGAKAAAAIMGMNNIYYRFVHLSATKDYAQMPARLRMNVIGNPGWTRSISNCGRSPCRPSTAAACASRATSTRSSRRASPRRPCRT